VPTLKGPFCSKPIWQRKAYRNSQACRSCALLEGSSLFLHQHDRPTPFRYQTLYVSYQLYGSAVTAIKISILIFYRRIFSTAQFRKWIYGVGALVLAWLLANNLVFAFQCTPIRKAWELDSPGHCINHLTSVRVLQVFNVLLDVTVLALPVSAVLRLQLSTARKISVMAIFLLGGL